MSIARALGAKGFRPFFLLAGGLGAVLPVAWVSALSGGQGPRGPLQGVVWHAHEMLHGLTVAVIAGFLLTAVSNWTGRETVTGAPLLALAAIWLSARVALFWVPGWLGPALDLAFLPALAAGIGRPLLATANRRNYGFVALLVCLWGTNLAVHADAAGLWPGLAAVAGRVGVHLVTVIVLVVAGRVVPMFTRNATGVGTIGRHLATDAVAVGAATAVAAAEMFGVDDLTAGLSGVAGLAAFARMRTWGSRHTLRQPLLWVLHVGHAFVAFGLLSRAIGPWFGLPGSASLHAVTVGGFGVLMVGMMARVSLGHTGRPLAIGPAMAASFLALVGAAVVRVLVPWVAPGAALTGLWLAAGAWAIGFALFTLIHAPILCSPRADGRPD